MMYAMQKQNTKCKKTFKYFESLERFVDEVLFDLETNNHSIVLVYWNTIGRT